MQWHSEIDGSYPVVNIPGTCNGTVRSMAATQLLHTWHMQWHSEIDGSHRYATDVVSSPGLFAGSIIFQVVGVVFLLRTPCLTALKRFVRVTLPLELLISASNAEDKSI